MANEQNLIQNQGLSRAEVQEVNRKGGIKSGQVRAFRKTFKEEFIEALSDKQKQKELIDAMIKQAKKGNVKAFEVIRDTLGEKPKEEIEASLEVNTIKVELKDD